MTSQNSTPVPNANRLVVRWTIGDVRERGFEMLRLSVLCAVRLFGPEARYVVCVNTVSLVQARHRTGLVPDVVEWREVTRADVPEVLREHFDDHLIEGMGWKLVPLRVYPERYELAIDNDCILWALPAGMRAWLSEPESVLFAEDVDRCLGTFDAQCPSGNYNAGIRGLPPGRDLEPSLRAVLQAAEQAAGGRLDLRNEIEEQGLQAAAVLRNHPLHLVRTAEVSICSPFWPRSPELGPCGAHFVGMNAAHIPWNYYDRPADDWLREHWQRHRPALYAMAGISLQ